MSDLTPDDDELLERARSGLQGTPEDHARVKRKLFAQIGIAVGAGASAISASSGATAGAAGTATAGAGLGLVGKMVVTAALVSAIVGGGVAAVHRSRAPQPVAAVAAAQSASATARGSLPAALPLAEVAPSLPAPSSPSFAPPTVHEPELASPGPVAPVATPRHPTEPARHVLSRAPEAFSEARTPVPSTLSTAAPQPAEPAESTPQATAGPPPRTPQGAPPMPAAMAAPSTLDAEEALLRRADAAAKAGDPGRALTFVDEHASRFPAGILAEEREAERVVVLCALGRTADARAKGQLFLRSHPRSPLAVRVRAACGGS